MEQLRKYCTVGQAAALLECSEQHIRNLFADGTLKGHRTGGKQRRISRDCVQRLLEQRRREEEGDKATPLLCQDTSVLDQIAFIASILGPRIYWLRIATDANGKRRVYWM